MREVTRLRLVLLPLSAKHNAGKGAVVVVPFAFIPGVPSRSRVGVTLHYLLLTISRTSFKPRVILALLMPSISGSPRNAMHFQCYLNQASRGLKASGDPLVAHPPSSPLPISVPCFLP